MISPSGISLGMREGFPGSIWAMAGKFNVPDMLCNAMSMSDGLSDVIFRLVACSSNAALQAEGCAYANMNIPVHLLGCFPFMKKSIQSAGLHLWGKLL
jgi:hypothetical protein